MPCTNVRSRRVATRLVAVSLIVATLSVATLAGGDVFAQNAPRPGQGARGPWPGGQWPARGNGGSPFPPGVMPEQLRGEGTIKEVGPNGMMHVVGAGADQWYLAFAPQLRTTYSATADASWLAPSLFVQFTAQVDKRGKIEGAVQSLKVLTPSAENPPGVKAVEKDASSEGLFQDEATARAKAKKAAEAAPVTPTYTITGRLTSVRDGKIVVSAGGATVSGELDDKAKVSVDLTDLSLMQPGDLIEFDGQVAPMQKSPVWTRSVTVNAAKPLSAESRSAAKKRPTRPSAADADKKP